MLKLHACAGRARGERLRADARTYGDRLALVFRTTVPVERFWIHGRTLTVTRSVSLVVFLTVNVPTPPRLAVVSTDSGRDRTRRPAARPAPRGAESSALGDDAAGRGPRDGKAEGAGDQPTPSELHFGYLLDSLLIRAGLRYGVSVDSVTKNDLAVAASGLGLDLLAQVDRGLGPCDRLAPAREQRLHRRRRGLERRLAHARLQRQRQQLRAVGQTARASSPRRPRRRRATAASCCRWR